MRAALTTSRKMPLAAVVIVAAGLVALLAALAWPTGGASQGSGQMVNCPQSGKWSIAVWDGADATGIETALDTCSTTVEAAFALDPDTQLFSRFFRGRPEVSNLQSLGELEGVLALGGTTTAAAAEAETLSAAQDSQMVNCPQPGKWAIAVWDGADGTDAGQALATCGTGAVAAAYHIDPATQGWLRWFDGRPEVSNLSTLDEHQGVLALGAAAAPAPISFGVDESVTPAVNRPGFDGDSDH